MSWTALLWALDQEPETATDKMVLVALANFVSEKDGNYCYPGHEALAERARCSVDTARRSVARLQAGGFLRIKREKAKNGQHLLARYHLAFHVTTRAPDGRTKVHAANCGVDEFDPSPERPSHAENACDDTLDIMGTEGEDGHPADCGMDTKNHPASHPANHPANCNHNHRNLKNLRTPPYPLEGEGERASDVPSGDAGNATKRRRAGSRASTPSDADVI